MKTTLRRLFNYWLPPGRSSDTETPNPLVEVAVKIQASTAVLLAGAEVDWDEIERENEEWFRLVERHRQPSQPTRCDDVPNSATYETFNNLLKQCETAVNQALWNALDPSRDQG